MGVNDLSVGQRPPKLCTPDEWASIFSETAPDAPFMQKNHFSG